MYCACFKKRHTEVFSSMGYQVSSLFSNSSENDISKKKRRINQTKCSLLDSNFFVSLKYVSLKKFFCVILQGKYDVSIVQEEPEGKKIT